MSEVCRKMGVSEQTFYHRKNRFQGMGVAEVRRLGVLEEENRNPCFQHEWVRDFIVQG